MKNQYFGDKRDLFKFDLLLDLMASGRFRHLTYVPMLTRPEPGRKEGLLLPKSAGKHNCDLFDFLYSKCVSGERDIRVWKEFFLDAMHPDYRVFRDDRADYEYVSKSVYFNTIDDCDLRNACVFIDPDIGIENGTFSSMTRLGIDKYLFVEDIESIVGRSEGSVVVIYQHLQRHDGKRLGDIAKRAKVLCDRLGLDAVPFVRRGDLAFFAVAKDQDLLRDVAKIFSEFAEKHGFLPRHVTDALFVVRMLSSVQYGVNDLAVFGSVARGEQHPDSDIDVLASFEGPATLRGFFDLQRRLELHLGRQIDLVTSKAVRSEMRPAIEREALHAA